MITPSSPRKSSAPRIFSPCLSRKNRRRLSQARNASRHRWLGAPPDCANSNPAAGQEKRDNSIGGLPRRIPRRCRRTPTANCSVAGHPARAHARYTSRVSDCRANPGFRTQGCWSDVWLGTRSRMILRPRSFCRRARFCSLGIVNFVAAPRSSDGSVVRTDQERRRMRLVKGNRDRYLADRAMCRLGQATQVSRQEQ